MFGEKKSDIFRQIPAQYIPKTEWIAVGDVERAAFVAEQVGYPIIAKPDIGERGIWVQKIDSIEELRQYVRDCPVHFLIQELVDYPMELGVFYVKYPGRKGIVSSIVRKSFLSVKGDGVHTVGQLLQKNQRAQMTIDFDSEETRAIASAVPPKGEEVLIEPIGNHNRGTMFLNDNAHIDDKLNEAFNKLSDDISGFFFGRFDLKCRSYDDLKKLEHFKILELNGAGAEPGHIYQPGYPLWRAYKDILWHLAVLSDISAENRKRGHSYWSFKQGFNMWRAHRKHNRLLASA